VAVGGKYVPHWKQWAIAEILARLWLFVNEIEILICYVGRDATRTPKKWIEWLLPVGFLALVGAANDSATRRRNTQREARTYLPD
jgi:hypothetical protein